MPILTVTTEGCSPIRDSCIALILTAVSSARPKRNGSALRIFIIQAN